MRRINWVVAALAMTLGLAACSGSGDSSAASSGETADDAAAPVDASLRDLLLAELGDGEGGIVVWHRAAAGEEPEREAVGEQSPLEGGGPLAPTVPTRIGSITKTFVATVVMQLVEEGALSLDDPIADHLPDHPFAASGPAEPLTVRHLLSHRSGIANYTDLPTFFPDVDGDPDRVWTPGEIVDLVADTPAQPGAPFAYSNTNYIVLGQLIEAIEGESAGDVIARRITTPLGLDTIDLATESADDTAIVSTAWTAGAMRSSADDLAAFIEALAAGDVVSADSLAAMIDIDPASIETGGYGLGLLAVGVNPDEVGWGHGGGIPGGISFVAHFPDTGETVVILSTYEFVDLAGLLEAILEPA